MQVINPALDASYTEAKRDNRRRLNQHYGLKRIAHAKAWLHAEHDFVMATKNIRLGNPIRMTGHEACIRNAALETKFAAALQAGKLDAKLWRWCDAFKLKAGATL